MDFDLRERVHNHLAREVTGGVPAHAVGHTPQTLLRTVEPGILVQLSDLADIAAQRRAPGDV